MSIIENEFQANPEYAFNPRQPDEHSLIVRDADGNEVLNIRFLNPRAMRIVGRFQIPGLSDPVLILPSEGIRWPGGGGIGHLTVDLTASRAGFIDFPSGPGQNAFPRNTAYELTRLLSWVALALENSVNPGSC